MCGSRKLYQRTSNSDNVFVGFFLVDQGTENQNITKSGPLSDRQRKRNAGGPMVAQHRMLAWFFRGSGPVLLRNPIFL